MSVRSDCRSVSHPAFVWLHSCQEMFLTFKASIYAGLKLISVGEMADVMISDGFLVRQCECIQQWLGEFAGAVSLFQFGSERSFDRRDGVRSAAFEHAAKNVMYADSLPETIDTSPASSPIR
jgi:hypothetical protein